MGEKLSYNTLQIAADLMCGATKVYLEGKTGKTISDEMLSDLDMDRIYDNCYAESFF